MLKYLILFRNETKGLTLEQKSNDIGVLKFFFKYIFYLMFFTTSFKINLI